MGGYYTPPLYPDTRTANGLSNAITNYLLYNGGMGNRINVIGIRGRKSTTLKGTADLDCTMPNGKNAKIEIKVGTDRPRDEQLEMQKRVRKTGGVYEFIRNMNEFYYLYDTLVSPELFL